MGTNPDPNCTLVLFWSRWGASSACLHERLLQCHHLCSPTANAPDIPLFLQLYNYCSTPALGRGWSWRAHCISSKAVRKSTGKKDIHSLSQHILHAYCPLHKPSLKDDAGIGLSAQQGQGAGLLKIEPSREIQRKLQPQLSQRRAYKGTQSRQPGALLVSTWAASFGVSFLRVFPMAIAANASWVPRSCSISCCLFLDENINVWPACYRGIGNFRSLLGKNMAKINLSHRSAGVSCSREGRKGLTPHWIHFCLSRVLAASVWEACIVSLLFVIRFPMVVTVTYLTLFELIKPGNQGKHISGRDLLPKDISAEGGKKGNLPLCPAFLSCFIIFSIQPRGNKLTIPSRTLNLSSFPLFCWI